eukprot:NP_001040736.2 MATH (meprin-associated Traf homology) domain containing [Caenorhabditis elegans]
MDTSQLLLPYTIENVSNFSDEENRFSDELVWRKMIWKLEVNKSDGFLGVFLYCSLPSGILCNKCQISAKVEYKIVSANGKIHSESGVANSETKPSMEKPIHSFPNFIKWREMDENFLIADSAKIEVHVQNLEFLEAMLIDRGEVSFFHTVKNVSRLEENEVQFGDSKACGQASWFDFYFVKEGFNSAFGFSFFPSLAQKILISIRSCTKVEPKFHPSQISTQNFFYTVKNVCPVNLKTINMNVNITMFCFRRIGAMKKDGFFGFYLQYENNLHTSTDYSATIEPNCWLGILPKERHGQPDGKFNSFPSEFDHRNTRVGNMKMIEWKELRKKYMVNDSVVIAAVLPKVYVYSKKQDRFARKFVLSQKFSDVSNIAEGESRFGSSEKRFNIPWRVELKRESGFLAVHLHCEEGSRKSDNAVWEIIVNCVFNLVSANGRNLMRRVESAKSDTVFHRNNEKEGITKFIRWDDMMTDYVVSNFVIIEARVDMCWCKDGDIFEPDHRSDTKLMSDTEFVGHFFLACTVNNVSKFQDGEKQWSDTETRHNLQWRIQAIKKADFLGIFLFCDNAYESHEGWSIQTEVTFNLVSTNGHNYKQAAMLKFEKAGGQGITEFIKWDNVIETYFNPLKDNLIVEAHVKVYFIKGVPHEIPPDRKSFLMSHVVRNVSNMEEENVIFSASQEWFDILWSMSMKNNNGFVELLLSCDKEHTENEIWCIQAKFQLMLVGADDKILTDFCEHNFENAESAGDSKVIRWEDMLSQYVVDDSVTFKARVVFTHITDLLPSYSFTMLLTLKDIPNVQEGESYFSNTEKHCDAPWRISATKEQSCILIYLHCDKRLCNDEHWSIKVEAQLVLVSDTGRTLTDKVTHIFERPEGIHWTKDLTWENLEKDFMVDDSVKIEARVKIVEHAEVASH